MLGVIADTYSLRAALVVIPGAALGAAPLATQLDTSSSAYRAHAFHRIIPEKLCANIVFMNSSNDLLVQRYFASSRPLLSDGRYLAGELMTEVSS